MQEIRIYESRKSLKLAMMGGAMFLPITLAMINLGEGGDVAIGWFATAIFGLIVLTTVIKLLNPKPQLLLNKEGFCYPSQKTGWIYWRYIHHVYVKCDYGAEANLEYICVDLKEEYLTLLKRERRSIKLESSDKFGHVNITMGFLELETEKLLSVILAMMQAKGTEKQAVFIKLSRDLTQKNA